MDPEEYRKKIEQDILQVIEEKLANGKMSAERAKSISQMVLQELHPHLTLKQIYEAVSKLDNDFSELYSALLPILEEHDERIRTIVVEHAQKLIQMGKIDEADDVLKEGLSEL